MPEHHMRHLLSRRDLVATLTIAALAGSNSIANAKARGTVPMTASERAQLTLVENAFAKWAAGTGGPYDLLAPNAVWTIVGHSDASRTYSSRDAFMSEVIHPFNARMSEGLKPSIRQITADGDKVIIFFDAAGVAKDGQPYKNTYAWFWEMRDGHVTRAHAFFDSITFNDLWRRVQP
jgi:ketosteroid isomerase-like protein